MSKIYYLDSNAHVPLSKAAQKIYIEYQNSLAGHGHPSARSKPGREAANHLELARNKIAKLLGAEYSNQIIFYSTCTESISAGLNIFNNWAKKENGKIYVSPIEHESVRSYIKEKFNNINNLDIDKNGKILDFKDEKGNFIVCLNVHNEIGTIYTVDQIKNANIFSDMSQSIGKIDICLSKTKIDIACFSGHKFGGLVGILYLKDPTKWIPNDIGSRYGMDRSGSPDVASILATAEALQETLENIKEKNKNYKIFQDKLEKMLLEEKNLKIEVIGKDIERVSNTTLLKIPQISSQIQQYLSEENIFVGTGSACNQLKSGKNLSLQALGIDVGKDDLLRISWNEKYDEKDAEYIGKRIIELTKYYKNKI